MKDNLILVRATELQKGDVIEFLQTEAGDVPFKFTVGYTELYDGHGFGNGIKDTVAIHPIKGMTWFSAGVDFVYGVIR